MNAQTVEVFQIPETAVKFKTHFHGKNLARWVEFNNRNWDYEQPPMDDRNRLYLYYRESINSSDDIQLTEQVTLIPVYSLKETDGIFPQTAWQIESWQYRETRQHGWKEVPDTTKQKLTRETAEK